MQDLLFFQSLWAMELRRADGVERSLDDTIAMIAAAGYDGVSANWSDRAFLRRLTPLLGAASLTAEGQCYPTTVDDLKPAVENALAFNVHHLVVQADVRPRSLEDCLPLLEGWQRIADDAGVPLYIETHRDRMTNDLHFTLDLLNRVPTLKLLGDLSHYVVAREFAWPVTDESNDDMRRIMDRCWAFHGRVASPAQVQVELSFDQHQQWFDQFLDWWEYGFRSWRRRAGGDETLTFVCELGPRPYAITGRDGEDSTDRWAEALLLRDRVRERWARAARDTEKKGSEVQ